MNVCFLVMLKTSCKHYLKKNKKNKTKKTQNIPANANQPYMNPLVKRLCCGQCPQMFPLPIPSLQADQPSEAFVRVHLGFAIQKKMQGPWNNSH